MKSTTPRFCAALVPALLTIFSVIALHTANGENTTVAVGGSHSLYVTGNARLLSMGNNENGQLGAATATDCWNPAPMQVAGEVSMVSAGGGHSLFITCDGNFWAMGRNDCGQLGDGTTEDRRTAVHIASGVIAAAAGGGHSLYITSDGKLWAMGRNDYGQLGDGTTIDRYVPVQIAVNVVSVSAGELHSMYVTGDGKLWSMGDNLYGQLGKDETLSGKGKQPGAPTALESPSTTPDVKAASPTPPKITSQPRSQTVAAGAQASFNITVAQNSLSTYYTWQYRSGPNGVWTSANTSRYQGGNTRALTINGARLEMNGYQYRCYVSNSSGNSYSNIVTLTVTNGSSGGSSGGSDGGGSGSSGGGGAPSLWLFAAMGVFAAVRIRSRSTRTR